MPTTSRRWLPLAIISVAIAVAIGVGMWWVGETKSADVSAVQVAGGLPAPRAGEAAPDFTARTVDGQPVSLSALRGQKVWLVFMATWCTGCRSEMPDIQAAHDKYANEIQIVTIYVGQSADDIRGYGQRLGLTFSQVPDADSSLSAAYGVAGVPTHFFLDSQGTVRYARVGLLGEQHIDEAVRAADTRQR